MFYKIRILFYKHTKKIQKYKSTKGITIFCILVFLYKFVIS